MSVVAEESALEILSRAVKAFRDEQRQSAYELACEAKERADATDLDASKKSLIAGWYGYLLATEGGELDAGLEIVRAAAKKVFWEAYIYENLARLELLAGSRKRAVAALNKGLRLFPDNICLMQLQEEMGVRRRVPVPFLKRSHPVNNALGRMMRKKGSSDGEDSES